MKHTSTHENIHEHTSTHGSGTFHHPDEDSYVAARVAVVIQRIFPISMHIMEFLLHSFFYSIQKRTEEEDIIKFGNLSGNYLQ